MLTEAEADELRASCTRYLAGHGPTLAADALAAIPPETVVDRYGDGGVVAELEAVVADVLGTEAAVFLPSGVMAQQIVLRVHAERRGRRTVLYHPMCHLEQHEGRALERLQGLVGRPVGEAHRLLSADDLGAVAEPAAALLIELPQRDLGGQQPTWQDLEAQVAWAREHGAAAHLDGARLWESAAGYGVPPARSPRCSTPSTCPSTRASARSPAAASRATPRSWRRCANGGGGWAARSSACGRSPPPP